MWQISVAIKLIFKMCVGNFLKLFCDGCGMAAALSAEKQLENVSPDGICPAEKMFATNELGLLYFFC